MCGIFSQSFNVIYSADILHYIENLYCFPKQKSRNYEKKKAVKSTFTFSRTLSLQYHHVYHPRKKATNCLVSMFRYIF